MATLPVTSSTLVARADDFADTLAEPQRRRLLLARTPAALAQWSNLPQPVLGERRRVGLPTATLTPPQWQALWALLEAAMGEEGSRRVRGHLDADDQLLDLGGPWGYGRDQFVVAFLGTPADTGTWTLQFGGHHLAVAHTYRDGVLAGATPSFRGLEPYVGFLRDGRLVEPEGPAHRALGALLSSLDRDQRRAARVRARTDLRLGPGRDWAFPSHRAGAAAGSLSASQRELLTVAIAAYVTDVEPGGAAALMARYTAELDDTWLGFSGSTRLDRVADYVRITGPSVWIEFTLQEGIVCPGPHAHAVWRDRTTDYGGTHF